MNTHQIKTHAVEKAILIAGSQAALAAMFEVKQQNISYWLKNGLPPKHLPKAKKLFNGHIKLEEWAPELKEDYTE